MHRGSVLEWGCWNRPYPYAALDLDNLKGGHGKAFGCSVWRETGCGFKVWKVMSVRKLSAAQVKTLLKNGQKDPSKEFRSRVDRPFQAVPELDVQNGSVFDCGDQELPVTPAAPRWRGARPDRRKGGAIHDAATRYDRREFGGAFQGAV